MVHLADRGSFLKLLPGDLITVFNGDLLNSFRGSSSDVELRPDSRMAVKSTSTVGLPLCLASLVNVY